MCGRYILKTLSSELQEHFHTLFEVELAARYNIAPTQPIPVIHALDTSAALNAWKSAQPYRGTLMHWGLVPAWSKDIAIAASLINARSETANEKPSFRHAFRRRRCLIPADGFYEWQKANTASGAAKQPFLIQRADEQTFARAGRYETWMDEHGNELDTCTILTCPANEMIRDLHERMPVILPPEHWSRWLTTDETEAHTLHPLLQPLPAEEMTYYPVSPYVNSAKHEGPQCVEKVGLF